MYYVYLKKNLGIPNNLDIDDVGIIKGTLDRKGVNQVLFLKSNVTVNLEFAFIEVFDIKSTGDRFDHKICDRCFKRLSTKDKFSNNRIKKDNVITKRPSCKACRKIKDGKAVSGQDRKLWEKKTPAPFTSFTCPICNKTTITGITKIVLDHDHQNGNVRGYLCESCNTGIGRFDDDIEIIKRAIDWLKID
jgi:hypothetical protein